MDKKDILFKSRMENNFGTNDENSKDIYIKSFRCASVVVSILCLVFLIITDFDRSYFVIAFSIPTASYIYRAIKLKTKSEIINAVTYGLSFIVWVVLFILKRFNIW